MNPSIIIADDHPLVLKGLQGFLTEKNYNILGSATNGKEAYKLILKHEPDIAILDIRMPHLSGIEIAELCNEKIDTKIILITFEKNGVFYHQAKQLNIYGYLLKEFALVEIENCLKSVIKGAPYFSKEIEDQFPKEKEIVNIDALTPSEKRILKLIANNKTAKEIAKILCISNRTVEKHKSHIIKKFNLESKHNSLSIFAKENEDFLD
ncbi:response regulator transcription factor [Pontimicrobium aquaticum]|uniref:Response regulator transcription factor n=1 Tax=Pontimicrobium aquaticum TaxID=2565367 RepID=A0A4U0ESN4_9FLAO|nr:response regulator transcription factor [Pontimicrobium aquaticum]TJY34608.1 response regulator transcription factor [Pontimicrobium aquaticum]